MFSRRALIKGLAGTSFLPLLPTNGFAIGIPIWVSQAGDLVFAGLNAIKETNFQNDTRRGFSELNLRFDQLDARLVEILQEIRRLPEIFRTELNVFQQAIYVANLRSNRSRLNLLFAADPQFPARAESTRNSFGQLGDASFEISDNNCNAMEQVCTLLFHSEC